MSSLILIQFSCNKESPKYLQKPAIEPQRTQRKPLIPKEKRSYNLFSVYSKGDV